MVSWSSVRRYMRNENGIALPMVLIVFLVGFALVTAFLVAIVGSAQVSSTTRSGIQAQAAAEAGIDAGLAQLDSTDVCSNLSKFPIGEDIISNGEAGLQGYSVFRVQMQVGDGNTWSSAPIDCPGSSTQVRLLSEGISGDATIAVERTYGMSSGSSSLTGTTVLRTANGLSLSGNANITASNALYPADVYVENGDFVCGASGRIEGSVYVAQGGASISGSCPITGNLIAQGNISISGSGNIGGSVYSVAGSVTLTGYTPVGGDIIANKDVTFASSASIAGNLVAQTGSASITGSGTVKKNLYAAGSLMLPNGKVEGSAFVGGNVTFSGGGMKVVGNLTYDGTASIPSWSSMSTWISGSVTKGGASSAMRPNPPSIPALAEWKNMTISAIQSAGYDRKNWEGSCTVTSEMPHEYFGSKIQEYGSPTLIDAYNCSQLKFEKGLDLKLGTDIVIVAKSFFLNNVRIQSYDGLPHKLWVVVPTDEACNVGGTPEIELNNSVKFTDGKITAMLYTACEVLFQNAGNDPWPGTVYSKTFSGYSSIKFIPMALPGETVSPPGSGGGAGSTGRATVDLARVLLQRNVAD